MHFVSLQLLQHSLLSGSRSATAGPWCAGAEKIIVLERTITTDASIKIIAQERAGGPYG